MGPRWRLMVLLGAFASLRPEELAELRRRSVDLDECSLRIRAIYSPDKEALGVLAIALASCSSRVAVGSTLAAATPRPGRASAPSTCPT
jgi:hypothetical protein